MRKISFIQFIGIILASVFFVACSVKKDRLLNREYHALTTKYNILFHGNEVYNEALEELKKEYFDDYWEILPVERIAITVDEEREFAKGVSLESKPSSILDNINLDGKSLGNANNPEGGGFGLAESKAAKAIQKHSMYIKGREYNRQMADAYLLLGKSRYYDGRFVPALEAFNYILYKYPNSSKVAEAKVWREKTNLRLRYDDLAIKNLKELFRLHKGQLRKETESEAYAMLAQGYINLSQLDSASTALKSAIMLCTNNELKSRYLFILGQLDSRLEKKVEAENSYKQIIAMNRKVPRVYIMHAYAELFELSDSKKTDSITFLKQYKKLLSDRENRPYLDILNRQVGLYYEQVGNDGRAIDYLKQAIKQSKADKQLKAKNYLSIGDIYFNSAGYAEAGKFYDSALTLLPAKAKETFRISKRREALRDVVDLEILAHRNDSILNLIAMTEEQRNAFFQKYVDELKKEDFRKLQANLGGKNQGQDFFNTANFGEAIEKSLGETNLAGVGGKSTFYFYSNQAMMKGKTDFARKWGNRRLVDNWRWSDSQSTLVNNEEENSKEEEKVKKSSSEKEVLDDPRYNIAVYSSKIPTDSLAIEQLKENRDLAYFELGSIYSERFGKISEGINRFESLLTFNPKERLILPTMYKLYKLYQETDETKSEHVKSLIINTYPDSRYAKLLQNLSLENSVDLSPEQVYAKVYKSFSNENYEEAMMLMQNALETVDTEFISKFELLNASIIARTQGLRKYKEALNYLALTYGSTSEGKEASRLLNEVIPALETKKFSMVDSNNWKVILLVPSQDAKLAADLKAKMQRLAGVEISSGLKFTEDYYMPGQSIYVLHGFKSKSLAEAAIDKLDSSIKFVAIMQEDYAVVQIKKNLNEFITPVIDTTL